MRLRRRDAVHFAAVVAAEQTAAAVAGCGAEVADGVHVLGDGHLQAQLAGKFHDHLGGLDALGPENTG